MRGIVSHSRQTAILGSLPASTYIDSAYVDVTEAFNSSGSDTLTVGSDVDPDAVVTSVDVSTVGVKTATLGVNAGYNDAAQPVKAFYTAGGTAPTTGKATITIRTLRTPRQP